MRTITKKWSLNFRNAYLLLLLLISFSGYAQDEVQCGSDAYFQTIRLRQNVPNVGSNGDFILYRVDPVAVEFTFVANLSVSDGPDDFAVPNNSSVNSLGINPEDRQFYFINPSSPYQMYRMTGTGNVTYLGNITGDIRGSNVSGVFDKAGNYYVTGGSRRIFQVDLNSLVSTEIMQTGINVSDIAISPDNDLIYGWDQGKRQLNTIDIVNKTVTAIGPAPNTSEFGTFGAIYFLPSGQLIGYGDNTTISGGQEALVDFDPLTGEVTQLGIGPSVSVNDGASCPFTLAIDKDGPESAGLNTTITYTFKIFNRTGTTLDNIFFQDILQDGLVFNSDPYNVSTGMMIYGTSKGQSQTDLVLNNVPIGVTTFQIDVFIDCDFPDMEIFNQAIIGIDSLDNPISSNDTDTAVIGDPTGTGIQPLELQVPEQLNIEGCDISALTAETALFPLSTTESADIKVEFNDADGYIILPSIDNVVTLTYVDVIVDNDSDCETTVERTFTATDNCDRTHSIVQLITIRDSEAPVAEEIPEELNVNCDEYNPNAPITDMYTAEDNCSGTIQGVPTDVRTEGDCENTFTITRTWSFVDSCGNESLSVQTINVVDITPPVFDLPLPGDITADCGAIPEATLLTATDNCGEVTVVLEESGDEDSCAIIRTWTATDSCGNSSEFSQTITVEDTEAPVFITSTDEEACVTGIENGAFEAIQFNGIITFEQIQQENIPGWSTTAAHNTIEIQRSGQIENEPSRNGNFHFELNGRGLDDLYQDFCTIPESEITITFYHRKRRVNDVVDSLELFAGSDLNNLTSLGVYSVTNADGWKENIVKYNVPANQETTIVLFQALTGSTPSVGNLLDDISVTSDQNNFAELPQDIAVNCDEIPEPEALNAEDNCSEPTVTVVDEIIPGQDAECPNAYTIVRTWTASDFCGNETSHTQNITVSDTKAPVFNENLPEDQDVQCDSIPNAPTLTAFDSCSEATVEFAEVITDGDCAYSITRTWTTTDDCGNSREHVQTINVSDTTAPTLVGELVEVIDTECGDVPEAPELQFEDSCSDSIDVVFNEENNQTNDFEDYTIVRTWTATDTCGNEALFTQTVNVEIVNNIEAFDSRVCNTDEPIDLFSLLTGEFDTNGTWTVVSGIATLDGSTFDPGSVDPDMTYTFNYALTGISCPVDTNVNVTVDDCVVLSCGQDDVVISKAVTANGDAFNEFFAITGIEDCGFVIELQIFNRWGAKIYESNDYQNDWNGQARGSSIGGSSTVPTGTYYYIINLKNSGLEPFAGPVYVATN